MKRAKSRLRSTPDSSPPQEVELKLALLPRDVPLLRTRLDALAQSRSTQISNIYFDTKDLQLARAGMALRLRKQGGRWLQTLKTAGTGGALAQRGEWESPAPGSKLNLGALRHTPLPAHKLPLQAVFRTQFQRRTWQVQHRNSTIEAALDEGTVQASPHSLPICELELEIKQGAAADAIDLALTLSAPELMLLPQGESKAARGYRLSGRLSSGCTLQPVKAGRELYADARTPQTALNACLRGVIGGGTEVLLANVHGLRESDAPEFVHQARVALRRMRSAIRLLGAEVPFPATLEHELRWVSGELGAARDADVFLEQTLPLLLSEIGDQATLQRPLRKLAQRAQTRARDAHVALRHALNSPRFATLCLHLLAWSHTPVASPSRRSERTIADFAPRALRRAQRRLHEAGRFFAALSSERQHRVRILAKRLRYAIELLEAALPRKSTERYAKRLNRLQDALGALNDLAAARSALKAATRSASLQTFAHEVLSRHAHSHIEAAEVLLQTLSEERLRC